MRLQYRRWFFAAFLALTALLAGCGFHMRGSVELPFESLYVDMSPANGMGIELKRNLRAGSNAKITETRGEAQAVMTRVIENRTKTILSINSAGRVREFRLRYEVSLAVVDQKGQALGRPIFIVVERDYSFNDDQVLAKESEEALLYRDMQTDMVQQIIRRMAANKPTAPAAS